MSQPFIAPPANMLRCNTCGQSRAQAESELKFTGQPDAYRLRAQCRLCGSPIPDWKVPALLQQS